MAVEGTQPQSPAAFQERRRLQSEAPSDMADCGSSIGHLDDLASVGTVSFQHNLSTRPVIPIGRLDISGGIKLSICHVDNVATTFALHAPYLSLSHLEVGVAGLEPSFRCRFHLAGDPCFYETPRCVPECWGLASLWYRICARAEEATLCLRCADVTGAFSGTLWASGFRVICLRQA